MTAELTALGIPFFGTKADLIQDESPEMRPNDAGAAEGPQHTGSTITSQELSALQRRMLGLLEDLCGE